MFIQISRETMLFIYNLHKNVRDNCSLTYAFIANIPLEKFTWLCYITLYNANSLKIPLKVNAFPFKNKDKSHIFHGTPIFTLCSAAPCLFCFEAICDRYFFKGVLQSVCKQSLCLHFCVQNIELYSTAIYIFKLLEYNK